MSDEIVYAIEKLEEQYRRKEYELKRKYPAGGQILIDMLALQHEIILRECEWMIVHRNDGRTSRHTVAVRSQLHKAARRRPLQDA